MRMLVGCEFSGAVRDAFTAQGWEAWSCDLLPSETQGNHHQGDLLAFLDDTWKTWDLFIGHPECTYLCNSGVRWLKDNPERWDKMRKGAEFFRKLWDYPMPRVCLENPIMHGHSRRIVGLTHSQIIQPWMFGDPFQKSTCLWLKNLPHLVTTNILDKPACGHWSNQTPSGQNKLGPSPTRAADRARTYQGVANAMATQWTNHFQKSRLEEKSPCRR